MFDRAARRGDAAVISLSVTTLLVVATGCVEAGNAPNSAPDPADPCSAAWYQSIEDTVPTGDRSGHGPDIGSDEWKSVVEFKLGIQGSPDVPGRDSEAWCRYIDQIVAIDRSSAATAESAGEAETTHPSFACDQVEAGSIEAMICGDEGLSALDRKLAAVYAAASKKAVNQHPPVLKAEQRGWIKGRNECWNAADPHECVSDEYQHRIAELQARYRLVEPIGSVYFICGGNPANEVVVTFFRTDPQTLIAERGDSVSLMYQQRSASGIKYQGRNETFWEHQGQATITWGYGAPEMGCVKKP